MSHQTELLQPIEEAEALKQGFVPLTYPIDLLTEEWIIDKVIEDMNRGNIPCVIVIQPKGLEVWRKSRFIT